MMFYNYYYDYDKSFIFGLSDSKIFDDGKLKIMFYYNCYKNIV